MCATSNPDFGEHTEALEVAKAFPEQIRGKTIIVTGVNQGGIGYATAQAFASQKPLHLIIAGRNLSRIQACINNLKKEYPDVTYRTLEIELSSQKSVRDAANLLLSWDDVATVDIVINNAAVSYLSERQLSDDGIEMTFATNHIGHFLLVNLIMPKLVRTSENSDRGSTRIINITSLSPTFGKMRWSDINLEKVNKTLPVDEQPNYDIHRRWGVIDPEEKSYLPLEGYHQSKVANVLFSIALNRRLYERHGILSLACHPGIIQTELLRSASDETKNIVENLVKGAAFGGVKTLGAGAATSLVAALDPKLGLPKTRVEDGKENYGVYLLDCQISDRNNAHSSSIENADRLWRLSEALVGETFAW